MIEADVRGKLGRDGSRAHDRLEDLFTSTVFGLLRYLPPEAGIHAVLGSARRVFAGTTSRAAYLAPAELLPRALSASLHFWPTSQKYGEPDLLIEWRDHNDKVTHATLVEVKLHSPKSGEAGDGEVYEENQPDPDQLVKYWQLLNDRFPSAVKKRLVYLTSHLAPPNDELLGSLSRAPKMHLAWLSWRDVWRALEPCAAEPAMDLKRLLAHRGFKPFSGFNSQPTSLPQGGFWSNAGWFSVRGSVFAPKGFWRK